MDRQPNIVLIVCDDIGYGDLGCYGSTLIKTPRLDALAEEGVRLTHLYSAAPTCTPSRAGLLTGRQAVRVGLPKVLLPQDSGGLLPGVLTLADHLSSDGYRCGSFGKWHLGSMPDHGPLEHGFETYFGLPFSNDMEPLSLWRDADLVEAETDISSLSRRYTDEAIHFIESADDRPFFAYLAFTMPHYPIAPEPGFAGRSQAGAYGDVVEAIDHYVGEIYDAVRRLGRLSETVFVFTSDHGPRFEGSTGGLRGRKFETWEGGMRVPGIVVWPELARRGTVSDAPVSCLDLLPTILAARGRHADEVDGEDISAVLRGDDRSQHGPIFFYDESELDAIRMGRWKVHRRRHTWGGGDRNAQRSLPQLFDLESDPAECYDLSSRHPDIVLELLELLRGEEARNDGGSRHTD